MAFEGMTMPMILRQAVAYTRCAASFVAASLRGALQSAADITFGYLHVAMVPAASMRLGQA